MTLPKHALNQPNRREALSAIAGAVAVTALSPHARAADSPAADALVIDPTPCFELSPYLYMQFMEPLGATDGSVEAAWDHLRSRWRPDVIEETARLAPTLMRWGGIYTDYYRWREGVGPRDERPAMLNLLWGGIESNQIGTNEFVDFCRQVGADSLMCVNFESDGRQRYMRSGNSVRTAGADEAAEWVDYCNRPDHPLRRLHGFDKPHDIHLWQIGNETSYDREGFNLETAARKTEEFARAMHGADPSIELIGWGDSGWAGRMIEVAGEHLKYVAFHHMFDPDDPRDPVLRDNKYREDPDRTWDVLMRGHEKHERKIREVRDSLDGREFPLAMTECHYAIPGRDRCDVLSSWAAGVSYARILNLHQRHGDLLKIATAADFCGNRWQVNAVMVPTPRERGASYLMPVARVMRLYRKHSGERSVGVDSAPDGLDVVASRTGDKLFLHVVNTHRTRGVRANLKASGMKITDGKAFEIASPPEVEVTEFTRNVMKVSEKNVPASGVWEFPAASVTAVVLSCEA